MYRHFRPLLLAVLSTLSLIAGCTEKQDSITPFTVTRIGTGLGVPWGLVFLTDTELLITERAGQLRQLNTETGKMTPITGVPTVYAEGQGGLLDIAIPGENQTPGWIYFTYSKPVNGQGTTALARAQLKGRQLVMWQDLLVTKARTETSRHFGSRIAFDDQGHVFFSVGDRGIRENAQNLTNHAGKILRLNLDGSVPADNPFVGRSDALPEIWSYGHRNPQGLHYDKKRHILWEIEHGPRGGDEINRIERGRNYGWPVISYGKEYWGPFQVGEGTEKPGMEQPVKYYVPSIAPGSLWVYAGKAFPQWQGDLFAGALALTHLNQVRLDAKGQVLAENRWLTELNQRIRAVTEDPRGRIIVSTDSGNLYRLSPH